MTTIINNPGDKSEEGMGMGMILGLLVVVVLVVLFFTYGIPAMKTNEKQSGNTIKVELPAHNTLQANPSEANN